MENKESKRPKLDTLDERREYLFTQFDLCASDPIGYDYFDIPESQLIPFLIRVKETYGTCLYKISARPVPHSYPLWDVSVEYFLKK